jgi:hypothetical protein
MNVEDVKMLTFADLDIDLKTGSRFQQFTGKIIRPGRGNGKTTQYRIPIRPSPQLPRLTEAALVAQFFGEVACLARLFSGCSVVYNFLQRNDVSIDFFQNLSNS